MTNKEPGWTRTPDGFFASCESPDKNRRLRLEFAGGSAGLNGS